MLRYLCFLILLISTPAFSALFPPIPTITIGGQTLVEPITTNAKTLIASIYTASNLHATFRTLNGTSGYVVPGGKTFRMRMLRCSSNNSAANGIMVAYSDNDVGMATNTAFTNEVYIGGISPFSASAIWIPTAAQQNITEISFGSGFTIPTGKYPGLEGASGDILTCYAFGAEE